MYKLCRNCDVFWKNLHSWQTFYTTTTSRGGRDKFQLCKSWDKTVSFLTPYLKWNTYMQRKVITKIYMINPKKKKWGYYLCNCNISNTLATIPFLISPPRLRILKRKHILMELLHMSEGKCKCQLWSWEEKLGEISHYWGQQSPLVTIFFSNLEEIPFESLKAWQLNVQRWQSSQRTTRTCLATGSPRTRSCSRNWRLTWRLRPVVARSTCR